MASESFHPRNGGKGNENCSLAKYAKYRQSRQENHDCFLAFLAVLGVLGEIRSLASQFWYTNSLEFSSISQKSTKAAA